MTFTRDDDDENLTNWMLIDDNDEYDVDDDDDLIRIQSCTYDDDGETMGSPRAILELGQILSKTNQIKSCNFLSSSCPLSRL